MKTNCLLGCGLGLVQLVDLSGGGGQELELAEVNLHGLRAEVDGDSVPGGALQGPVTRQGNVSQSINQLTYI